MSFTVVNNTITSIAWQFDDITGCGYNNADGSFPPFPIMPGGTFGGTNEDGMCIPVCLPDPGCDYQPRNYTFSGGFASGTNASGTIVAWPTPACCFVTDLTLNWTASRQ